MGLFSKPKDSYLGVDIGSASIKVVELEPWGGQPKLVTYGYIDIVTDVIHSKTSEAQDKIVASLKKVIDHAGVKTNLTLAALPTFSVFNSIISLPAMSDKDLSSAVRWEAKKYVPLPLEEMILDWKIIDDNKKNNPGAIIKPLEKTQGKKKSGIFSFLEGKNKKQADNEPTKGKKKKDQFSQRNKGLEGKISNNIRVLVTAAPKNLVSRYLKIFKNSGLKLLSLETESFALARSLIGSDKSTVLIVDIGSINTDICVIDNSIPILNRSIDVGGRTITKAIANSLNINMDRAEQFKRDFGVSINQTEASKGINKTIANAISPIINEIKYVFDLYQGHGSTPIEKIVLSGGSAFLPNLTDYFEKLFNKPAIIGSPWSNVIYPEELKPVLDEVGSRLSVSIGLAMRDIKK